MRLLLLLWLLVASARASCVVSNGNSTECPPGCALLLSTESNEAVAGEFVCSDGPLRECTPPFARVADSLQRALVEPPLRVPQSYGGPYRTDTDADGWFAECVFARFDSAAKLLEPFAGVCDPEAEGYAEPTYACVCPASEPDIEETPSMKIRHANATYALGASLGYDDAGVFRVYRSGYYTIAAETNRTLAYLAAGAEVSDVNMLEAADRAENFTLLYVANGTAEIQVGADFSFGTGFLVAPWRSVWELVWWPGNATRWSVAWREADEVVVAPDATFMFRDVLSTGLEATRAPTTRAPTSAPTAAPTTTPTSEPTSAFTDAPTATPTTLAPSRVPTSTPTLAPTVSPTRTPTFAPSETPTLHPSETPTLDPTHTPTLQPTLQPTETPTLQPSETPTLQPTETPTLQPTLVPTAEPTTLTPTTLAPTQPPTTLRPTTRQPTTRSPTRLPTIRPTMAVLDYYFLAAQHRNGAQAQYTIQPTGPLVRAYRFGRTPIPVYMNGFVAASNFYTPGANTDSGFTVPLTGVWQIELTSSWFRTATVYLCANAQNVTCTSAPSVAPTGSIRYLGSRGSSSFLTHYHLSTVAHVSTSEWLTPIDTVGSADTYRVLVNLIAASPTHHLVVEGTGSSVQIGTTTHHRSLAWAPATLGPGAAGLSSANFQASDTQLVVPVSGLWAFHCVAEASTTSALRMLYLTTDSAAVADPWLPAHANATARTLAATNMYAWDFGSSFTRAFVAFTGYVAAGAYVRCGALTNGAPTFSGTAFSATLVNQHEPRVLVPGSGGVRVNPDTGLAYALTWNASAPHESSIEASGFVFNADGTVRVPYDGVYTLTVTAAYPNGNVQTLCMVINRYNHSTSLSTFQDYSLLLDQETGRNMGCTGNGPAQGYMNLRLTTPLAATDYFYILSYDSNAPATFPPTATFNASLSLARVRATHPTPAPSRAPTTAQPTLEPTSSPTVDLFNA